MTTDDPSQFKSENGTSEDRENPKHENQEKETEFVDPLTEAQEALKECQSRYTRLLADSENTRKRLFKERDEHAQFVTERLIVDFLQPLDSLEKALLFAAKSSAEVQNWATGFEMILSQFKQVLSNHGVHPFKAIGTSFDPHYHEAVEIVETTEYKPGTILEEFACGYKKADRLVRAARVKVAKKPPNPAQEPPQEDPLTP